MKTFATWIGLTALAGLALASVAAPPAQAQFRRWGAPQGVNPFFQISPGLNVQQAAYNVSTMGRAFSNVPPYALGFNPYPRPIINPFFPRFTIRPSLTR